MIPSRDVTGLTPPPSPEIGAIQPAQQTPPSSETPPTETPPLPSEQEVPQQQGTLLRSDLTAHTITSASSSSGPSGILPHSTPLPPPLPMETSYLTIPPPLPTVVTSGSAPIPPPISSHALNQPSSSSSSTIAASSTPSGLSSQVSFISTGLRPQILGMRVVEELQQTTAALKDQLLEKEAIEAKIHQRLDLYEADQGFAAEIRGINQAIAEKKMEYDRLSMEIGTQRKTSKEYISPDSQIDINEIKKLEKKDKKLLMEKTRKKEDLLKERDKLVVKLRRIVSNPQDVDNPERGAIKESINTIGQQIKDLELEIASLENTVIPTRENYRRSVEDYFSILEEYKSAQAEFQLIRGKEREAQQLESRNSEIKRELKSSTLDLKRKKSLKEEIIANVRALEKYQGLYTQKVAITKVLTELIDKKKAAEDRITHFREALSQERIPMQALPHLTERRDYIGGEIREMQAAIESLELQFLQARFPGDNPPVPISELRNQLVACESQILDRSNLLEARGKSLASFPPDVRHHIICGIAEDLLKIGKLPPRSSNPFNQVRREIIQEMVNIALTRTPPRFIGETGVEGKEAAGGIYQITVDVDIVREDGAHVTERRILGGFKPNDEAPGGRFARLPLGEVQPGLPPEVADIRQALVSALGGAGTIDSVLITAQHEGFRHVLTHPNGEEEDVAPPVKDGIFVEWYERAPNVEQDILRFARTESIMSDYHSRFYEDVAFLNWDPNEGNQLIARSSEGLMGVRYAWKQFDLDKAFPAGFVGISHHPFWIQSPLARQPLPFEVKDRIRHRDVEKEIEQASHFWNAEIDLKIARIEASGDTSANIAARVAALEACRWSDAHANVLRASDTLLKVAIELDATPAEVFVIFQSEGVSPYTNERLRQFLGLSIGGAALNEIKKDLNCMTLGMNKSELVDLDSILCREFVICKSWALKEIDDLVRTQRLPSGERARETVKLTQQYLKKQLTDLILKNRLKAQSMQSTQSTSSSLPPISSLAETSSPSSTPTRTRSGSFSRLRRAVVRSRSQSSAPPPPPSGGGAPPSDQSGSSATSSTMP